MKPMKTIEANITKNDVLEIKHEKQLRSFVEKSYDTWQSGKQKPIDGNKVLARIREKIAKK
jgi:hypothetical protein